jgi:hypothetical protein
MQEVPHSGEKVSAVGGRRRVAFYFLHELDPNY